MIRVRLPNGLCLTYNNASKIGGSNSGPGRKLLNAEGDIIAIAPLEALVEFVLPCRIDNDLDGTAVERVAKMLRDGSNFTGSDVRHLVEIKRLLGRRLNATTRELRP